MSQFVKDFKAFALKGNIIDLAVGVVIGAAFNAIITSLVNNVLMPLISAIFNSGAMSTWKIVLREASIGVTPIELSYGLFLQSIINFVIIALSVFVVLKILMKFKRKEEATTIAKSEEVVLLEEIRDALVSK